MWSGGGGMRDADFRQGCLCARIPAAQGRPCQHATMDDAKPCLSGLKGCWTGRFPYVRRVTHMSDRGRTWDRVLKLRRRGPEASRSLSVLPPGDGGTANSTRRPAPLSPTDLSASSRSAAGPPCSTDTPMLSGSRAQGHQARLDQNQLRLPGISCGKESDVAAQHNIR